MPHIAPILGLRTERGAVYCRRCVARLAITGDRERGAMDIYADNAAFQDEHCDACGKALHQKENS